MKNRIKKFFLDSILSFLTTILIVLGRSDNENILKLLEIEPKICPVVP